MPASSPFQLLGLPERFDLDEATIRRAYLARVAATHPDLASGDDTQAHSADLNRARDSLADPESRANSLLELRGGPSKEADKSLPPAFLVEIMETREAIEAAFASGDSAEKDKWLAWGLQQRADYISTVRHQFANLASPPAPDALKHIRVTLNQWRYIERLIERFDPAPKPFN